jgi:hypothetical protein
MYVCMYVQSRVSTDSYMHVPEIRQRVQKHPRKYQEEQENARTKDKAGVSHTSCV